MRAQQCRSWTNENTGYTSLQARDNLCPSCRSSYRDPVTRHRYAERIAGELAELRRQYSRLAN